MQPNKSFMRMIKRMNIKDKDELVKLFEQAQAEAEKPKTSEHKVGDSFIVKITKRIEGEDGEITYHATSRYNDFVLKTTPRKERTIRMRSTPRRSPSKTKRKAADAPGLVQDLFDAVAPKAKESQQSLSEADKKRHKMVHWLRKNIIIRDGQIINAKTNKPYSSRYRAVNGMTFDVCGDRALGADVVWAYYNGCLPENFIGFKDGNQNNQDIHNLMITNVPRPVSTKFTEILVVPGIACDLTLAISPLEA